MNEAMLYSLVGFILLALFFMFSSLWLNKRLRRYPETLQQRQPNLQDPYPNRPESAEGRKAAK